MTTEEGNKFIAEFMNLRLGMAGDVINGDADCHVLQTKYHTSWDWLKPVVDKIFEYSLAYPEQSKWVCSAKIVVDILPCWENVVKFIQFLNTHKPKPPIK